MTAPCPPILDSSRRTTRYAFNLERNPRGIHSWILDQPITGTPNTWRLECLASRSTGKWSGTQRYLGAGMNDGAVYRLLSLHRYQLALAMEGIHGTWVMGY